MHNKMIRGLVTVIIPFYRSEDFIRQCIESVQRQTYKKLEIILVDDESPDNCGRICDEYAEKDSRIKVIHQKNRGVCEARNSGLKMASGQYVMFVDGDDWLAKDCIEYLLKIMEKNNAEMAMSDCVFTTRNIQQNQHDNVRRLTPEEATCEIIYAKTPIGPWNKLYSMSVIRKNNLSFSVKWFGEGLYFSAMNAQLSNSVAYGHRKVYVYRKNNPNSGTTMRSVQNGLNALENIKYIQKQLVIRSRKTINATNWHIWKNNFNLIAYIVGANAKKEYKNKLVNAKKYLRKNFLNVLSHSDVGARGKIEIIGLSLLPIPAAVCAKHLRKWLFAKDGMPFWRQKPRVLIVVPTLRIGTGVASHVMTYYGKICNKIDIDFITFTKIDNLYTREIAKNGGKIFFFEKNLVKSHAQIKRFFKEKSNDYDIIHCHAFNYCLPYLYFAKKYKIQSRIIHAHNPEYSDKSIKKIINLFSSRLCIKTANCRVACSRQTGDKVYRGKSYSVINNAIDLARFANGNRKKIRTELGIDDQAFLFGNVGRLTEQKNQTFLLDVFAELKHTNRFKNSKILIVGKGPDYQKLLRKIVKLGLERDVYIVSETDCIEDYYAAMDCFIFPSKYEGLGMTAVEAQASGLPCFCSASLPEEIFCTELTYGLSLELGARRWASIIERSDLSKKNVMKDLIKCGFDIGNEGKKVVDFYSSLMYSDEIPIVEAHKLKVAQYIPAYNFGGIETVTYELNKELRNDCEFIYLVERDVSKENLNKLHKVGARVVRVPSITKESFWRHNKAVRRFFKSEKIDILHVHDCDNRFFVMIFAKIYGVKNRIYHIHSKQYGGTLLNRIIKTVGIKINIALSTACLACSSDAAECKGAKRYGVIENGMNVNKFKFNLKKRQLVRKKMNVSNDSIVVLFVGRVEKCKNVEFLIKILKRINEKTTKKVFLMIVGDGSELKRVKEIATGMPNVIFVGQKNNVADYYFASDCLCLPSDSEGLPMVTLEAQASGLSCIVSNGVPRDIDLNQRVSHVGIEEDDIDRWVGLIIDVEFTPCYERLRSLNVVKKKYGSKIMAEKMLKIYRSMC